MSTTTLAETARHKLETYIKNAMRVQYIPGLALTILKDGNLLYLAGYGFANLEHEVPVTLDTLFHSGSTGKMFVAAVMLLAQKG
jgi:CubicO group peptidase (beta-lactamase class C family)